jgi:hypothetical protein
MSAPRTVHLSAFGSTPRPSRRAPLRAVTLALLLIAVAASALSCADETITTEFMFNSAYFISPTEDPGNTFVATSGLEALVVGSISRAKRTVDAAFEDLHSTAVAQALIDAQSRGVRVRIVGDADHADHPGMALLLSTLGDAASGGAVRLGNGALTYNPQPTSIVSRSGDMNRMTHNFVIVDERELINLSGGFPPPDRDPLQLALAFVSQDIPRDFGDEFDQMHAGVFATTLDLFNGPLKSNSNPRVTYPNNEGDLELFFGPQERIIKRIIDEVYAARASIYIAAEALSNTALAEALAYKHATGFSVRILISRDGLSEPNSQVEFLRAALSKPRLVNHPRVGLSDIQVIDDLALNLVLIDAEPSPVDNQFYLTKALSPSQPLIDAIPFLTIGGALIPQTADVFCDSNMWVINQYAGKLDPRVTDLSLFLAALLSFGQPLPASP